MSPSLKTKSHTVLSQKNLRPAENAESEQVKVCSAEHDPFLKL